MLGLFGPVQLLVAAAEPSIISDLAVDTPINYGRGQQYCTNGQLPFAHTNMAIFVLLFTVCAFEVIFVKIVTAIRDGMGHNHSSTIRSDLYLTTEDHDNNNSVLEESNETGSVHQDAWHWMTLLHQNIQRPTSAQAFAPPQRFISNQTFLQRMAQATAVPFDHNNNNNHNDDNNNNQYH